MSESEANLNESLLTDQERLSVSSGSNSSSVVVENL